MSAAARSTLSRLTRGAAAALATGALAVGSMAATTSTAEAATVKTWKKLAWCESTGRWHINSTYDGGLQFSPTTWRAYGGGRFAAYAYQAKPWQQMVIAEKTLRGQGWGAWPSCSAKLGLTQFHANQPFNGHPKDQKPPKLGGGASPAGSR